MEVRAVSSMVPMRVGQAKKAGADPAEERGDSDQDADQQEHGLG